MQLAQEEELLATELLEALPESVVWFSPIWSYETKEELKKIIDFEVHYCNQAACSFLHASKEQIIGKRLLHNNLIDVEYQQIVFDQCVQVWETGKSIEDNFYNTFLNKYFSTLRSRIRGGVLSISRDRTEFYKAETERQKQADLLNQILDATPASIITYKAVYDESGQISDFRAVTFNKHVVQTSRHSPEELYGSTFCTLYPDMRTNGVLNIFTQVLTSGHPFKDEIFIEPLGGWFNLSVSRQSNDQLIAIFLDITQRKKNKLELEYHAARLQTVIHSSNAGIITGVPVMNTQEEIIDFRFTLANDKLVSYLNKKPEWLIGKLGSEVFPGYKRNGLFELIRDVYLTKKSNQLDLHYHEDGFDAWINLMATPIGNEILITFNDYTKIKKLQQQIESTAAKLNTVIDSSQVGIHTLSPIHNEQGEIVDFLFRIVNPTVAAYIGQKAETLIDEPASKWFPAYLTNGLFETYKKTFETGEVQRFNFHYEDGYDVYFDIQAIKMEEEVLVTFSDHTTIKKLQFQLENSIEELKRSNSNLEEFAYAASHDLQEPLRKIHFFSNRLKEVLEGNLSKEAHNMFDRMEASTTRMRTLIDDLLTYSRISTKPRKRELVSLKQIVQQVVNDLEAEIAHKLAIIHLEELPIAEGDPTQIRQMFQNLISNSLKYSKANVPPVIKIRSSHKQIINEISHQIIEITDNGIGFEQEHAQKIFQVFHRLHGKSEYPGTGVGLAIVQKVVNNHNWFISAEGIPGEGAIFRISLPEIMQNEK